MLGLYVHVPFCTAICNYCNFTRGLVDASLRTRYVAALLEELRQADGAPADTLYVGGGTPSLLDPDELGAIIDAARGVAGLIDTAEITIEANPETVDAARLRGFRQAGVNRLSFGVQSFHDEDLRRLGRVHSAARAVEAISLARAAGFDNISLDLMMWLPEQSLERWLDSVDAAIALGPEHASLYMLEVYPHLPLKAQITAAGWAQASDDDAAEMYLQAMDRLERAGYEQYEISNVARPGRRSHHNLKYWSDGEWLGFGPAAHSTRRGVRWRNVSGTEDYIQRVTSGASVVAERRELSVEERLGDALFTGLRLREGVDLRRMAERYGTDVWQRYGASLEPYVETGLLVREGSQLRLTRPGMLLAHEVMAVFV